ncbi:pimeloyl-ACP methyl ester carboxylesterase [Aquimarina sp. MAR_2010_214]|uniref:alpha/beta fold hydrolase n=1 Tax=Aquimarina sp. MAR_2010_214 TaxID=1250026 RepID=UPI000C712BF5|nr:alpha/beta hydrolase [Aquimarina sp. MAR_2010_214]PKV51657.1 pimeloyl-ACP methyl ester carboxylesterase [Aquimarina sp. MAR_2010_214]
MKSLYNSEFGKNEILNLYNEKLDGLEIEFEDKVIDTNFGKTNIIIVGDSTKPPLLLVHGSNGCAPIALETYPTLYKDFQVFAIDVLAQPNKSAETRLSMKDNSYGLWINNLISQLELKNVTMVGFSFGGLIILKTLIENQNNIKEVILSAPAFIVNGNPIIALFKVFIPMKRYIKTKNTKYLEKFLDVLFSEKDEFALRYLSKVFLYFNMDFTPIPIIKKEEAQLIKTPITIIAAKRDIMFPGKKMIKRANNIFPSLKNTVLLENSKHVLNRIDNTKIEKLIMKK